MSVITRTIAACVMVATLAVAAPAGALPLGADLQSSAAQDRQGDETRRKRAEIEERARSQIGAPYRYGGESPSGFDCSGFTRWVYRGHGADLPHSSQAQFDLAGEHGYKRVWPRSDLETGDLVFHDTGSGRVGHAGIYVGNGKFISATSSEGVQVRSLYDSYWGPRWVGATRIIT